MSAIQSPVSAVAPSPRADSACSPRGGAVSPGFGGLTEGAPSPTPPPSSTSSASPSHPDLATLKSLSFANLADILRDSESPTREKRLAAGLVLRYAASTEPRNQHRAAPEQAEAGARADSFEDFDDPESDAGVFEDNEPEGIDDDADPGDADDPAPTNATPNAVRGDKLRAPALTLPAFARPSMAALLATRAGAPDPSASPFNFLAPPPDPLSSLLGSHSSLSPPA